MNCPACGVSNTDGAVVCFGCGRSLNGPKLHRGAVIDDRYELLESLGQGGFGMVVKARDRKLDEVVAMKFVRPEQAAKDPRLMERFRREIKLARRVRHPKVCGIHEYGEDGGLQYIVMDYIEGSDLRSVVRRRGRLSEQEAYDVTLQIAAGLEAVHAAGVIHRDLKPANVMLDASHRVRLMDFGIAKQAGVGSGLTSTGVPIGTPQYMSPEQLQTGDSIDFRSDVYALGVLTFELFTGSLPFDGELMSVIHQQFHCAPPLDREGIPLPMVSVLARALAKNRDDRYPSVREYAAAVAQARGETPAVPAEARTARVEGATALQPLPEALEDSRPTVAPRPTAQGPVTAVTSTTAAVAGEPGDFVPTVRVGRASAATPIPGRKTGDGSKGRPVGGAEPRPPLVAVPDAGSGRRAVAVVAGLAGLAGLAIAALVAMRSSAPSASPPSARQVAPASLAPAAPPRTVGAPPNSIPPATTLLAAPPKAFGQESKPLPRPALLRIETAPENAEVKVDGRPYGSTSEGELSLPPLDPGRHVITVSHGRTGTVCNRTVDLRSGENPAESFDLSRCRSGR